MESGFSPNGTFVVWSRSIPSLMMMATDFQISFVVTMPFVQLITYAKMIIFSIDELATVHFSCIFFDGFLSCLVSCDYD